MTDSIIKVEGLGKKYTISHERRGGYTALRDVVADKAKNIFKKKSNRSDTEEFWALKDVNFEVKKGEALGIIGRNGAGKSTLLKILSRITEPTHGRVELNGRVASLLEVGTGFHPELTGRENIYLNGAILGMTKSEIKSRFDEIVDFSGVEKFLDTPVKRYSSGMYVRLAFSVAAHMEPEILVVDEVLSVGDDEFQKKCLGKMNAVSKSEGRTVLFVSHDINAISQLCMKSILLKDGTLNLLGETNHVIAQYLNNQKSEHAYIASSEKNKAAYLNKIELVDEFNRPKYEFLYSEKIRIRFEIGINDPQVKCNVFVVVMDAKKRRVFSCESESIALTQTLVIDSDFLVRGEYSINAYINIAKVGHLDIVEDTCHFTIIDNGSPLAKHGDWNYGVVFGRYTWNGYDPA